MFTARGRAHQQRWMRRAAVASILLGFVVLLVLTLGWPLQPGRPLPANVSFKPQKKMFGVGERPVVHLHLGPGKRTSLLSQRVFADSLPQATVLYDGLNTPETAVVTPDGSDYDVTLDDNGRPPRAGTYDVTVTGQTNTGQPFKQKTTFTWGALALNTDKSVYVPGQTAQLQFGVVNTRGNTVCKAPLTATVTDPDGQSTSVPVMQSDSCKGDSFSNQPDYTTSYQTKGEGTYTVTATLADSGYSLTDTFKVASAAPFDVARNSVTRLFPSSDYGMEITVHVNQDFVGQVKEVLPAAAFKVSMPLPAATQTAQDGKPALTWDVDWKAGSTQVMHYQFTPPLVSPAFYQIDPLTFTDQSGAVVFKEARSWQFVDDAVIAIVGETYRGVKTASSGVNNITITIAPTAGNAMILLFAQSASGGTNGIALGNNTGVTDTGPSGSDTWIAPTANPSVNFPNLPNNFASGIASESAAEYAVNIKAVTSLTVTVANGANPLNAFAFDLLEVQNMDAGAPAITGSGPVENSVSAQIPASGTTNGPQDTPTLTASICTTPTTDLLLRGGEFFCTATNELIIADLFAGHAFYGVPGATTLPNAASAVATTTGLPGGAPNWTELNDLAIDNGTNHTTSTACASVITACGVLAYTISSVAGSYFAEWNQTPNSAPNHNAAGFTIAFRQSGNTSGGDKQYFYWAQ